MSAPRKATARHRQRRGLPAKSFELVLVLVIVLILLLIALPSYLAFKALADSAAAKSNLRSALPAVDAYFALTNSSYAGLDLVWLKTFDPGVQLNDPAAAPSKQTATTYCISATVGGKTWYKAGPEAPLTTAAC